MAKLYYRLNKGLNDINYKFYPIEDSVYNHIDDFEMDWYQSIYYYTEEQVKEALTIITSERNNTTFSRMRGVGSVTDVITGEHFSTISSVVTNKLCWDFDSKNIEQSRMDTKKLLYRLLDKNIPENAIQVSFSGGKGFSVVIEFDKYFTPEESKEHCRSLAADLQTFDVKIYNPSRIFRVPLTKHNSGLYKTPLPIETIMDYETSEIKKLAKHRLDINDIEGIFTIQKYKKEYFPIIKPTSVQKISPEVITDISKLSFNHRMVGLSPAKWVIMNGLGYSEGERHDAYMCIGSYCRSVGWDRKHAYSLITAADRMYCERTDRDRFPKTEIWLNILESVYSINWQGGTYGSGHPLIQKIEEMLPSEVLKDFNKSQIIEIEQSYIGFLKYAKDIDNNTIKFGIRSLDSNIRMLTGNLYGLLAAGGVGKTSFGLTVLNNTSKQGVRSIYFCCDMGSNPTMQKLIQKHTGLDGDVIFENIKNGNQEEINKYQTILKKEYNNVHFSFNTNPSLKEMKDIIQTSEEMTGQEVKLILVDYLELIRVDASDSTAATSMQIQGLRQIANEMNKCVVVLMQPNKANSIQNEPILSSTAAKGSGDVDKACTAILTAYRPGFNPEDPENDKWFSVICVKNRLGELFRIDYAWEGKTGKIKEMIPIEHQELRDFITEKNEKQKEKKGSWGVF